MEKGYVFDMQHVEYLFILFSFNFTLRSFSQSEYLLYIRLLLNGFLSFKVLLQLNAT